MDSEAAGIVRAAGEDSESELSYLLCYRIDLDYFF